MRLYGIIKNNNNRYAFFLIIGKIIYTLDIEIITRNNKIEIFLFTLEGEYQGKTFEEYIKENRYFLSKKIDLFEFIFSKNYKIIFENTHEIIYCFDNIKKTEEIYNKLKQILKMESD